MVLYCLLMLSYIAMSGGINGNWFDDDPDWIDLKSRAEGRPVPKVTKQHRKTAIQAPEQSKAINAEPKKVQVSVNFTLPKKPRIPAFTRKLTGKNRIFSVVAVGVVTLGVAGGLATFRQDDVAVSPTQDSVLGTSVEFEQFDALLPVDKNSAIDESVKFDSRRGVTSYSDKIGIRQVVVSQQLLPEQLAISPDTKVEELAKSFNANEIVSSSSPRAYIGTSADGPETVIFHKEGRLVFIFANGALDRNDLAEYITKLK